MVGVGGALRQLRMLQVMIQSTAGRQRCTLPPRMPSGEGARVGRYVIGEEIAAGGMATVHLGRMIGDAGFARTVAIKRVHAQYTRDPEMRGMLLDEGRLSARIHHLNVVTTLDVVAAGADLFIVMEYVHGEPLSALIRATRRHGQNIPPRIVAAMLAGALRGLHAAHEARDARGDPLGVVHRDVSPQNILVGSDGIARVLDFGVAKAAGRMAVTTDGRIKGKFGYMPPEQLHGEVIDRRADIYAAGVVLWEALVGARLFAGAGDNPDFARLLNPKVDPPSTRLVRLSPQYDAVVMRALSREAQGRYATALEMAQALEACGPVASPVEVAAWVTEVAGDLLAELSSRIAAMEARLLATIRDSLHLIESSDARVTELDGLAASLSSNPPTLLSGAQDQLPGPPALPSQPPGPRPDKAGPSQPPRAEKAGPSDPAPAPSGPATPLATTDTPAFESTGHDPFRPPGASSTAWIGVAALGALAIAATFAVIASVPGSPDAATAATATAGETLSASGDPPASAEPPPPPSAGAAATAEPPAPAATTGDTPRSSAPARARVVAAPPSRPPPPPRAPANNCSPPFTIDAAGHKHYKRECL
jgi:eukaryotic-like serine/threonine-protein kinase